MEENSECLPDTIRRCTCPDCLVYSECHRGREVTAVPLNRNPKRDGSRGRTGSCLQSAASSRTVCPVHR